MFKTPELLEGTKYTHSGETTFDTVCRIPIRLHVKGEMQVNTSCVPYIYLCKFTAYLLWRGCWFLIVQRFYIEETKRVKKGCKSIVFKDVNPS